jgi:glycerophosphoryl diester phosphodiesterase
MNRLLLSLLLAALLYACGNRPQTDAMDTETPAAFDWQGHRGARGLAPENTVPSFLKALEFPEVTTLELDVVISKDGQVVVSHEPWMSSEICSRPDGSLVQKADEDSLNIFQMTYAEIAAFDCGHRGNPRFPQQQAMTVAKPTLRAVVEAVESYCTENNRPTPQYNIEIKSRPEWDGLKTPPPAEFAQIVLAEIRNLGIAAQTCVQSFDARTLQAVHQLDSTLVTAYLVEALRPMETNIAELGYTPVIYSPYHKLVTAKMVENAHSRGMRIIPWTVNETAEMQALINLGVDGIITDYPDRIPK